MGNKKMAVAITENMLSVMNRMTAINAMIPNPA